MIEQTRFLSDVFLCREFKLENIYSGVNVCGKNEYLRELIFADRKRNPQNRKKSLKSRTRKNFVPHGI